jgi:hypothetical protein
MPRSPEVHVFQTEISGGKQITTGRKPQHGTIVANSRHYHSTFWQWLRAVTMPLTRPRFGGNFNFGNERFF